MSRQVLRIYYDVVSPYAYFAFTTLSRYAPLWSNSVDVVFEPILLGGIMAASGNVPPMSVPAKAKYMRIDLDRGSRHFGVKIVHPRTFPQNTLLPMRILTHLRESDDRNNARALVSLSKRFFESVWSNDEDLSLEPTVRRCIAECGLDAEQLIAAANTASVKDALKRRTQRALDSGAFGAPWIVIDDNDPYWGSDRFELIAAKLGKQWRGPIPAPSNL